MSHDRRWREPCASTDRDSGGRWLWRLVRLFRRKKIALGTVLEAKANSFRTEVKRPKNLLACD